MDNVTLWDRDSLSVTASGGADGVSFDVQDLHPPEMFGDEYEYRFSVAPADVPKLVETLGGTDTSEVMALIQANAEELITKGIVSWLNEHDIPVTGFWSWFSP